VAVGSITRSGLPVEINTGGIRKLAPGGRDSEGAEGWVYHSLVVGWRRTAVVTIERARTIWAVDLWTGPDPTSRGGRRAGLPGRVSSLR